MLYQVDSTNESHKHVYFFSAGFFSAGALLAGFEEAFSFSPFDAFSAFAGSPAAAFGAVSAFYINNKKNMFNSLKKTYIKWYAVLLEYVKRFHNRRYEV